MYLRARYYNPALGVFPSTDPFEGDFNNPLSLNRHAYVQGNVVNWTDPLGYGPELCLAALAAGPAAPAVGLTCALAAGAVTVGALVFGYLASQAAQHAAPIRFYSNGTSVGSGLTFDQALKQFTTKFRILEDEKSKVCSRLPPGKLRSSCEGDYTLRQQEELIGTIGPAIEQDADYAAREAEKYIEKLFGQPMDDPEPEPQIEPERLPYLPPMPPDPCRPRDDNNCKIEVRSYVAGRGIQKVFNASHVYIIATDQNGVEHIYRGGAERYGDQPEPNRCGISGRGAVTAIGELYGGSRFDHPELFNPPQSYQSVIAMQGSTACGKIPLLEAQIPLISGACKPYSYWGDNSNTAASTMLNKCGIPHVKPPSFAIGWNRPDLY